MEDLGRRTSNFFPLADTDESVAPVATDSPNVALSAEMAVDLPLFLDAPTYTPIALLTPSFLSPDQSFSLNLFGSRPASNRISYSTPSIFTQKVDLSHQLGLLSLGLHLDSLDDRGSYSESPSVSQRLSIWGTPYREEESEPHFVLDSFTLDKRAKKLEKGLERSHPAEKTQLEKGQFPSKSHSIDKGPFMENSLLMNSSVSLAEGKHIFPDGSMFMDSPFMDSKGNYLTKSKSLLLETDRHSRPRNLYSERLHTPAFIPQEVFAAQSVRPLDSLKMDSFLSDPAYKLFTEDSLAQESYTEDSLGRSSQVRDPLAKESASTPLFDPEDTPSTSNSEDVDPLVKENVTPNGKRRSKPSIAENRAKEPRRVARNIVVNLGGDSYQEASFLDSRPCNKYILDTLITKEYPEDYCLTFYKRNCHGYMFVRESSNSLKVNSSGSKSWVTIKLKLGPHEPQKVKVDVKRLPEWKPINLNLTSAPRRSGRRDQWKKSRGNRRNTK